MIQKPRGTKDIFGTQMVHFKQITKAAHDVCAAFAYGEVQTPAFEETALFKRSVGETSDIVNKEMYTFIDQGERSLTLRPEGTASIVRMLIENKLDNVVVGDSRFYYIESMYRYERPQNGRQREFNQFGVEVFGSNSVSIDFEVISLVDSFLKKLNIENYKFKLNSLGDPTTMAGYRDILRDFINKDELCDLCKERYENNVLRIIDCKTCSKLESFANLPLISDSYTDEAIERFAELQTYLTNANIKFEIDPTIIRGLDYYTSTIFEVDCEGHTICGGGRYDNLVKQLGGNETPAFGVAFGIERLILTLIEQGKIEDAHTSVDYFVVFRDNKDKATIMEADMKLFELRQQGFTALRDFKNRKIDKQYKQAEKVNAKNIIKIGD